MGEPGSISFGETDSQYGRLYKAILGRCLDLQKI